MFPVHMSPLQYSILGLGDVVIPGVLIAMCLRFDLFLYHKQQNSAAQPLAVDIHQASHLGCALLHTNMPVVFACLLPVPLNLVIFISVVFSISQVRSRVVRFVSIPLSAFLLSRLFIGPCFLAHICLRLCASIFAPYHIFPRLSVSCSDFVFVCAGLFVLPCSAFPSFTSTWFFPSMNWAF